MHSLVTNKKKFIYYYIMICFIEERKCHFHIIAMAAAVGFILHRDILNIYRRNFAKM